MNPHIRVEPVDCGQELGLAGTGWQPDHFAAHPGGLTCRLLVSHIGLAGRIVTDEHHREPGHDLSLATQISDFERELLANPLGQGFSIKERGWQWAISGRNASRGIVRLLGVLSSALGPKDRCRNILEPSFGGVNDLDLSGVVRPWKDRPSLPDKLSYLDLKH